MAKAPMDKLLLSNIHMLILAALLLLPRGKSFVEPSSSSAHANDTATSCIADERYALVGFKAGLSDPANLLSSWWGDDCCKWRGVHCSSRNSHVVKLDLPGHGCDPSEYTRVLGGNISSSLLGLRHLQYLNLSCNGFYGVNIPEFFGSLYKLRYIDLSSSGLIGRIPPQLGNLSNLQYLNLSSFYGTTYSTDIMWLSQLTSLEHLDLSFANLSTNVHWLTVVNMLPSLKILRLSNCNLRTSSGLLQVSNLTSLETLDLSYNYFTGNSYSTDITWLSQLTSLEHLDLSNTNLSTTVHWLPVVNMLTSLKILLLRNCNLRTSSDSLQLSNLTSLETLDLSSNSIQTRMTPSWFWGLPSLKYLDISRNGFYGRFPDEIGNLTSMVMLDLSANYLVGMIPSTLQNLCSLEEFFVHGNNINGSITEFILRLPSCSLNKLSSLILPSSNLTGSLPTKLQPLSNLISLDLSGNNLIGPVPLWIGELTQLTNLDLSYNKLDGFLHVSGLESLDTLWLSYNSIALRVNSTWVPPSNITDIGLQSCILGPKFPLWLRWLPRLDILDISNTSISDTVPDWFWITASTVEILIMRQNKISGSLPSTMEFMRASVIDLSSNKFNGPIPKLPSSLHVFDLSRNNLVGPLPFDFGAPYLSTLVLFDNSISGVIPSSLCKLQSLGLLDMSENKLSGTIPDCSVDTSTTNVTTMSIFNLSLRNNNLSGEFPSFLQQCQQLLFLDLSQNHFFGTLPTWIGEKSPDLAFLRLRSNMFYGHIPEDITKLVNLQYLDIAYNNLMGNIPKSIANFKGMISRTVVDYVVSQTALSSGPAFNEDNSVTYTENLTVVTKGQERLYTGEIIYMVNLDLSCNNLIGDIPEEISTLVELKNLNLSWNTFSGKIPKNIGALTQVESLDLSNNKLSGEIPPSLSALTSLSLLNLSYNNLTGEVPSGDQLQTLEDPEYIYIGNPGLCGPPLSQNCSQPKPIRATQEQHEDLNDEVSFFIAISSGYVMGLWVVFCTFLFKRKWRAYWYSVCDSLYGWVYVQVAVIWASWTREKCAEDENDR